MQVAAQRASAKEGQRSQTDRLLGDLHQALMDDWHTVEEQLPSRLQVLLSFTERLTQNPSTISTGDIAALRREGLSEADIVDAIHVIGLFNLLDRLADGTGLQPEEWMPRLSW